MKPLSEKTYVDQALKNGKGVTWLDDARIPFKDTGDIPKIDQKALGNKFTGQDYNNGEVGNYSDVPFEANSQGRFPANLVVSDDALNDGKVTKSTGGAGENSGNPAQSCYGTYGHYIGASAGGFGDSGSFSRYFDLDKWWEKQLEKLPEEVRRVFPFLIIPKASKDERNEGLERSLPQPRATLSGGEYMSQGRTASKKGATQKNFHPTVKPLKLMSYLITLGSRKGDLVLDPFIGSGTTALAARILGRHYIGIELNQEYAEIAKTRLLGTPFLKLEPTEST